MKRLFIIILLLSGIAFSNTAYSQTGGRKREKVKTKKRGNSVLTQYKSRGHADEFARGGNRRGFFSRLFRGSTPSWRYRVSGTSKSNFRDNQSLFSRNRTKGKMDNEVTLTKQNAERSRNRVRGSKSFRSRKYRH